MKVSVKLGDYVIDTLNSKEVPEAEILQLPELYFACMGEKAATNPFIRKIVSGDMDPWRWRNLESPKSEDNSVALAFYDGEIVGYSSYVALPGFWGGERALCMFGQDNMVHPAHRNRGLYAAIIGRLKEFIHEFSSAGMTYGFPNPMNPLSKPDAKRSESFRTNIGGMSLEQHLEEVRFCKNSSLSHEGIEGISVMFSNGNGIESFSELQDLPALLKRVGETEMKSTGFGIERSIEFLDWRYLKNPVCGVDYAGIRIDGKRGLGGIGIIKLYNTSDGNKGHILDLISDDEDSRQGLVLGVESYLIQEGADNCSLVYDSRLMRDERIYGRYDLVDNPRFALILEPLRQDSHIPYLKKNPASISAGDIDVF